MVLSKTSSAYFDHDKYMCLGDSFIQIDGDNNITECQMYNEDIDIGVGNMDELTAYIDDVYLPGKNVEAYGIPFTRSDTLSEIVPAFDYIARVEIGSISIKASNANRDTYY